MEAVEGALDKKNVLGESLVVWEIMITNTTRANARITLVRRSADKQILGVGEHGLAIGSGMEVVGHRVLFQVNEHLVSFGDDQIDMSQPMGVPTFIFYTISALFSPIAIQ